MSYKEVDPDNDGVISQSESDAHLEKMKEEMKRGPPPDFGMSNASDGQDWEITMLEKLLSAYNVTSIESADSISRYTYRYTRLSMIWPFPTPKRADSLKGIGSFNSSLGWVFDFDVVLATGNPINPYFIRLLHVFQYKPISC